jgi:hypothetical protein
MIALRTNSIITGVPMDILAALPASAGDLLGELLMENDQRIVDPRLAR